RRSCSEAEPRENTRLSVCYFSNRRIRRFPTNEYVRAGGGMRPLEIASAGAARGLLDALQASPATPLDVVLRTTYAPAGRVAARVRTDEPLDVVILTADLLKVLAHESRVDGATVRSIGAAQTGLAVRTGETAPPVRDAETLRSTLLACDSIFCPDTQVATSG